MPHPSGGGGGSQTFDEGTDTGTQWFVRPSGGGGTGASWSNAWNGVENINWSSLAAGDTVWVASGTYTGNLEPGKSGTSGSKIKIRRARADSTQCTSATGWNSSYDALVTHTGAIIVGDFSHIVISGASTQSGTDAFAARYGWLIDQSSFTSGTGVFYNNSATATGWEVRWLELKGAGEINVTGDMRAIDMTPFGTCSGHVYSHLKIHDWESAVYEVGTNGSNVYEYVDMYDIAPLNTATFHPNGIITWDSPNSIVRYSKFHKGPNGLACGEGVFFEQSGGSTGWKIYGNLFYDIDYTGVKAIEITSAVGAIKIFNNTFVNVSTETIYTSDSPSASSGEQRNNFVYNCGINTGVSGITSSNNVTASATDRFVNYASRDLHIVSNTGAGYARDAGTSLTADGFIDKDMDGNTRGADATWDCGAYDYA